MVMWRWSWRKEVSRGLYAGSCERTGREEDDGGDDDVWW